MAKHDIKNKVITIVAITVMAICLLGIIAIFVWDLVNRIRRGWDGNDTITVTFFWMILVLCPVMIKSFNEYFINNCKELIIINNDIYRLFIKMEENESIYDYEKKLISRDNVRYLEKINSIIHKKDKNTKVTIDNLGDYFSDLHGFYRGKANIVDSLKLRNLYNKIKRNKSISYEKLYKSVHNGDIIKKYKFPLFEFVIPLMVGSIGLFVTIYQALAINNSIHDSLLEYLKMFGFTFLFSFLYVFLTYRSSKEGAINYKSNILNNLELSNNERNN